MKTVCVLSAAAVVVCSGAAADEQIAFIDFEGEALTSSRVYENLSPTGVTINPPLGTTTFDGVFDQTGTFGTGVNGQLGWNLYFQSDPFDLSDTNPGNGPASSSTDQDIIGVTAGNGVGASNGLQISDPDGIIYFRTDLVDLTLWEDVSYSFQFSLSADPRDNEFFDVVVERENLVGSNGSNFLAFSGTSGSFETVNRGVRSLEDLNNDLFPPNFQGGESQNIFFDFSFADTGSTLIIDNFEIRGTFIPAPGAAAMLGLAGLAAVRRRR